MVINTHGFSRFWPFHGLLLTDFGSVRDFHDSRTTGCVYVSFINSPRFLSVSGLSHGLLLTILGSQSDFHGCRTPRCAYVLVVKNHCLGRFWPFCWTITKFWVPEVISTIDEPQGAFTCRSSALTILADSGLFRALLLTVLGSQSDFHD